jgi:hypothetical protein
MPTLMWRQHLPACLFGCIDSRSGDHVPSTCQQVRTEQAAGRAGAVDTELRDAVRLATALNN